MRQLLNRYLAAVVGLAALTSLVGWALPDPLRPSLWLALAAAMAVQGPLGWWVVRSIGTDRLLVAWGVGIGARVVTLVVAGILVPRALGWPASPVLISLAALLFAMLLLEGLVAMTAPRATLSR